MNIWRLAVYLALGTSAMAGDWPAYRHDARRSAITDEKLVFPLRLAWEYRCAQPPAPAWPETYHVVNRLDFDYAPHPVTGGGLVYLANTADDTIQALDEKTGEPRWHFITSGPVRFAPQFDAGRVFAASDDGFVYCLEAATGKLRWRFRAAPDDDLLIGNGRMISRWPVRTGVLVLDNTVYCAAGMWQAEGVHIVALNADTGRIVWRNDTSSLMNILFTGTTVKDLDPAMLERLLGNPFHNGEFGIDGMTPQGAPLADGNDLIIPNGNMFPGRFDRRTGAPTFWGGKYDNFHADGIGGTWGCIDDGTFFTLIKHRANKLWVMGFTLAGSDEAGGKTKRAPSGPLPQVNLQAAGLGPPKEFIHDKGKASVIVKGGKFYGRHAYSLALAGEVLLLGIDSAVVAQDPASEKELWRAPVTGIAREIAVANGQVLVSTDRGVIYCFGSGSGVPPLSSAEQRRDASATMEDKKRRWDGDAVKFIEQIRTAGMDCGYALVIGDADGQPSMALAAQTQLRVINALTDESAAAALREKLLAQTTWYGSRIHVLSVSRLDRLPFARYFANAVVVASPVTGLAGRELYRVLRPYGGVLLTPGLTPEQTRALVKESGAAADEVKGDGAVVRGRLAGAADWDNPAADRLVGGPMRTLWFGGPETMQTQSFKQTFNNFPAIASGRYFVTGESSLSAVDAYNGTVQWSRTIPQKHPEYRSLDGVVYAVADPVPPEKNGTLRIVRIINAQRLYLILGKPVWRNRSEAWIQIDAKTGQQQKVFADWPAPSIVSIKSPQTWPVELDATHSGAVTIEAATTGLVVTLTTKDAVGSKLDGWDLYFDLRPSESRCGLYERGAFSLHITPPLNATTPAVWRAGNGPAIPQPQITGERSPSGTKMTVTLSWAEMEKIGGGRPASFGFAATLNSHDGGNDEMIVRRHLFGDQFSEAINNGWANVFADEAPLTMAPPTILENLTKEFLKAANTSTSQENAAARLKLNVEDSLALGPRIHPLTGEAEPKVFRTGGGGCAAPFFSSTSSYGRAAGMLGLYDFIDDSGLRNFSGIKAGCSTAMTPALGVLLVSPESGHCVCTFAFRTTVTLAPADKRLNEDWAIFHDRPADTLVRQAAINLGAFGDRRDEQGTLWLGFPRPPENKGPGYSFAAGKREATTASGIWMHQMSVALPVPLKIEFQDPAQSSRPEDDSLASSWYFTNWTPNRFKKAFGPYRINTDVVAITGTKRPWLYGSGYRGLKKAVLKLDFRKPLSAGATAQPPVVDGNLAEPAWGDKPDAILPFTQTQVFLRQNADHLYIAMKRPAVIDRQGKTMPWSKTTKGDDADIWDDDSVEVFLTDSASGKTVHLGVAASGARYHARIIDASIQKEDRKWSGAWTSAVAADDAALSFELAIPFKTLADAGLSKDHLGINFQMNQKDVSGEALKYPGSMGRNWKSPETNGEALTYLGLEGRAHCRNFTPLGIGIPAKIEPRKFTVRLHFAELDDVKPGQRVFDVKLQDQVVLKDFDVVKEAGGARTALVKEFKNIRAGEALTLEFITAGKELTAASTPILNALELVEEGFQPAQTKR